MVMSLLEGQLEHLGAFCHSSDSGTCLPGTSWVPNMTPRQPVEPAPLCVLGLNFDFPQALEEDTRWENHKARRPETSVGEC